MVLALCTMTNHGANMKKLIALSFLLVFLFSIVSTVSFTQDQNWHNFYYKNYSDRVVADSNYLWVSIGFNTLSRFNKNDGIFETIKQVQNGYSFSFAVDKRHRLWFDDPKGLSMYDGKDFTLFTNTPVRWIWNIKTDTLGHVWLSSRDTLVEFDGQQFTIYTSSNSELPSFPIYDIEIDLQNNIWLATNGALVKFDRIHCTIFDSSNSTFSRGGLDRVHAGHNGKLYVIQNESILANNVNMYNGVSWLHIFDGISWVKYPTKIPNPAYVTDIATDRDGNVYMASLYSGIIKFDGANYTTIQTSYYSSDNSINSLTMDDEGEIWAAGDGNALIKLTNTGLVAYDFEIPAYFVKGGIVIDSVGTKWFATELGLARFDGRAWQTYNSSNSGLPANDIRAMALDRLDHLWLGVRTPLDRPNGVPYVFNDDSLEGGLVYFDGENWTVYNVHNSNLPSQKITAIHVDKDGIVWIGTEDAGLVKFDGTQFSSFSSPSIHSIASEGNNLWIATNAGITAWDKTIWTYYTSENTHVDLGTVNKIAVDRQGIKWFATSKGLTSYDGNTWTAYDTTNSPLISQDIRSIDIDYMDRKWIITNGDQNLGFNVINFDGKHWKVYDLPNGNPSYGSPYADVVDIKTDIRNAWIIRNGACHVLNANGIPDLGVPGVPPETITLKQNFPNPFNPETTIRYELPADGKVTLKIYNILGQEIRTLVNRHELAGTYDVVWNGTNDRGSRVSSGLYFYRLQAGKKAETKKLLLVK